jgi:hypothetical protein
MEKKKKHKQFPLNKKVNILEELDRGIKICDVKRKYGISPSTLSMFLKDRDKIEKIASQVYYYIVHALSQETYSADTNKSQQSSITGVSSSL